MTYACQAVGLTIADIDLEGRTLYVRRLKKGLSTIHPLRIDEIKALKKWLVRRERMQPEGKTLFISERRMPLSRKTAWRFFRSYGEAAELDITAHPHMPRHACGFALADQGADTRLIQDYLDHRTFSTPFDIRPPIRHGLKNCSDNGRFEITSK